LVFTTLVASCAAAGASLPDAGTAAASCALGVLGASVAQAPDTPKNDKDAAMTKAKAWVRCMMDSP
jgi:hypothetical protein